MGNEWDCTPLTHVVVRNEERKKNPLREAIPGQREDSKKTAAHNHAVVSINNEQTATLIWEANSSQLNVSTQFLYLVNWDAALIKDATIRH